METSSQCGWELLDQIGDGGPGKMEKELPRKEALLNKDVSVTFTFQQCGQDGIEVWALYQFIIHRLLAFLTRQDLWTSTGGNSDCAHLSNY